METWVSKREEMAPVVFLIAARSCGSSDMARYVAVVRQRFRARVLYEVNEHNNVNESNNNNALSRGLAAVLQ